MDQSVVETMPKIPVTVTRIARHGVTCRERGPVIPEQEL